MEELWTLNEEQRLPVLDTEGAVLVLAGAGSGKTRVLTARISHLIADLGVSPENILAITFTNKAAAEMHSRLDVMTDVSRMWVCTIHSMCVRILRMYADRRGLSQNFSIYSRRCSDFRPRNTPAMPRTSAIWRPPSKSMKNMRRI